MYATQCIDDSTDSTSSQYGPAAQTAFQWNAGSCSARRSHQIFSRGEFARSISTPRFINFCIPPIPLRSFLHCPLATYMHAIRPHLLIAACLTLIVVAASASAAQTPSRSGRRVKASTDVNKPSTLLVVNETKLQHLKRTTHNLFVLYTLPPSWAWCASCSPLRRAFETVAAQVAASVPQLSEVNMVTVECGSQPQEVMRGQHPCDVDVPKGSFPALLAFEKADSSSTLPGAEFQNGFADAPSVLAFVKRRAARALQAVNLPPAEESQRQPIQRTTRKVTLKRASDISALRAQSHVLALVHTADCRTCGPYLEAAERLATAGEVALPATPFVVARVLRNDPGIAHVPGSSGRGWSNGSSVTFPPPLPSAVDETQAYFVLFPASGTPVTYRGARISATQLLSFMRLFTQDASIASSAIIAALIPDAQDASSAVSRQLVAANNAITVVKTRAELVAALARSNTAAFTLLLVAADTVPLSQCHQHIAAFAKVADFYFKKDSARVTAKISFIALDLSNVSAVAEGLVEAVPFDEADGPVSILDQSSIPFLALRKRSSPTFKVLAHTPSDDTLYHYLSPIIGDTMINHDRDVLHVRHEVNYVQTLEPLVDCRADLDPETPPLPLMYYEHLEHFFVLVTRPSNRVGQELAKDAITMLEKTVKYYQRLFSTEAIDVSAREKATRSTVASGGRNVSFLVIDGTRFPSLLQTFAHDLADAASAHSTTVGAADVDVTQPFVLHVSRVVGSGAGAGSLDYASKLLLFGAQKVTFNVFHAIYGPGYTPATSAAVTTIDQHNHYRLYLPLAAARVMKLGDGEPSESSASSDRRAGGALLPDADVIECNSNTVDQCTQDRDRAALLLLYSGGDCHHSRSILPILDGVSRAFATDRTQVIIARLDVDVSRPHGVRRARDCACERRVLRLRVHVDDLARLHVRADLDRELRIPLQALFGAHDRAAYPSASARSTVVGSSACSAC